VTVTVCWALLRYVRWVAEVEGTAAAATVWTIHGERVVDETRRLRLSIAAVELPDGVRFEQYVLRIPKASMVAVVNEDSILMMRRHRFIIDRWVWELPGGYVDPGEDPLLAAAREAEEETGWRPRRVSPLVSFQPMVGSADAENLVYLGEDAEYTGVPADINEAEEVAWIPLERAERMIADGEIVGAASVIAVQQVILRRLRER
jgi:8-oxo-dGTP pyrophosphatase MutT (NUDIX family)